MTFNRRWITVARLVSLCCLLSACGTGSQKSEVISPKQRFDVARAAEASGNMGLARSMYAAAAAETTGDRAMQLTAAEGLVRTGATDEGMAVLRSLVKQSPNDLQVRRTLGLVQIMDGMPAQAVDTLSVVLAARPEDDTVRVNKGVALDMLNRHAEAQQLYRQALARNPSDLEAANDLAYSLMLSHDTAAARAVVAPFRGRADLPERMRTTIALIDGSPRAPGTAMSDNSTPAVTAAPTSLKPHRPPKKRPARTHPAHPPQDQAPDR